jgi:hypothetical protein
LHLATELLAGSEAIKIIAAGSLTSTRNLSRLRALRNVSAKQFPVTRGKEQLFLCDLSQFTQGPLGAHETRGSVAAPQHVTDFMGHNVSEDFGQGRKGP